MPCLHSEDLCEKCLEKVETIKEKCLEKQNTPLEKTMTPREKRNRILFDSSFLAAVGVIWYTINKPFFNIANNIFDSILETIVTPTE